MKPESVLKQYPEDEPYRRAAFLLYHLPMLLYNERVAVAELIMGHHPSLACLNLINAAFIRNMKLIKGVDLVAHAKPATAQPLEQHLTL